jgi:hypothetical protein
MATFPITVEANAKGVNKPGVGGPYKNGDYYYVFGTSTSDPSYLRVYRSLDLETWTQLDQPEDIGLSSPGITTILKQSGDGVWVFFCGTSGVLSAVPFDFGTLQWGAVEASSGISGPGTDFPDGLGALACCDVGGNVLLCAQLLLTPDVYERPYLGYTLFDGTWENVVYPLEYPDRVDLSDFDIYPLCVVNTGARTHVFSQIRMFHDVDYVSGLYHQVIGGGLERLLDEPYQELFSQGPFWCIWTGDKLRMIATAFDVPRNPNVMYAECPDADLLSPAWEEIEVPEETYDVFLAPDSRMFWALGDFSFHTAEWGGVNEEELGVSPSFNRLSLSAQADAGAYSLMFGGTLYFWSAFTPVPPGPVVVTQQPTTGGGTYFPRYLNLTLLETSLFRRFVLGLQPESWPVLSTFFTYPNEYDKCLAEELYHWENVDRFTYSCGRKPDCLVLPEGQWEEALRGSITFNPVGSVELPPVNTESVILSFRVPTGYDGLILAQFHQYTGPGFVDGSGDIVWRVRINGRYAKDMGNMLTQLGNNITQSPVAGGVQLRSGNLVEYIVEAPNTSGSVMPGYNILAGLHGVFYPRK